MRIAIADDSALFRIGLTSLLTAAGVEVIAEVPNASDLLRCLELDRPDVAVLDIRMPPTFTDEGLVIAEKIRRQYPGVGVLVLSTYAESHYAARLLACGPYGIGYLLKDRVDDPATLRDALSRISDGGCVVDPSIVANLLGRQRIVNSVDQLSERERDVLRLMAEGRSNVGIGQALFLSPKTVERHVAAVFMKLGLRTGVDDNRRVLAVLAWLRAGVTA